MDFIIQRCCQRFRAQIKFTATKGKHFFWEKVSNATESDKIINANAMEMEMNGSKRELHDKFFKPILMNCVLHIFM